jgi:hypothetical protein
MLCSSIPFAFFDVVSCSTVAALCLAARRMTDTIDVLCSLLPFFDLLSSLALIVGDWHAVAMGYDHGTKRPHYRSAAPSKLRSNDPYLHLLVKLYRFLSQRTGTKFSRTVLRRLFCTRINRAPLSLSRLVRYVCGLACFVCQVSAL